MRLLDGLTALNAGVRYRQAAEQTADHVLRHLQTPNGLLYWGGHVAWDLEANRVVGQYENVHEFKNHQPYYRLMWRLDAGATRALLEAVWAGHLIDWTRLDYNRHANMQNPLQPEWDCVFDEDLDIPFPTEGGHLSFCNVTPSLLHAAIMLAVLDGQEKALTWSRRLAYRWQQGRHPETGLCGGQLSYREADRAQQALGHVHPHINEAKIVADYHQISRYHTLPLAQMQAGEDLITAGGPCEAVGREFIQWASDDLKAYGRGCYDAQQGVFNAVMIDGTPIDWQQSRTGYYVPESFAPRLPDGFLLWGYATAYRLTRDDAHWQMLRTLFDHLNLGDPGSPEGNDQALSFDTDCSDWRIIYALLDLHTATPHAALLKLGCRIADNLLATQTKSGLFPSPGREYARTGDEIPLALLHLTAAILGNRHLLPPAKFDRRFFHCEYHGELEDHQKKRADKRTYDDLVFYGRG